MRGWSKGGYTWLLGQFQPFQSPLKDGTRAVKSAPRPFSHQHNDHSDGWSLLEEKHRWRWLSKWKHSNCFHYIRRVAFDYLALWSRENTSTPPSAPPKYIRLSNNSASIHLSVQPFVYLSSNSWKHVQMSQTFRKKEIECRDGQSSTNARGSTLSGQCAAH